MMVLYAVICFVLSFSAFNHITYLAEELLQKMAIFFGGFCFVRIKNLVRLLVYNKKISYICTMKMLKYLILLSVLLLLILAIVYFSIIISFIL